MNCIFCGSKAKGLIVESKYVYGWKCCDRRKCRGQSVNRRGSDGLVGRRYRVLYQQEIFETKVPSGVLFVATSEEI